MIGKTKLALKETKKHLKKLAKTSIDGDAQKAFLTVREVACALGVHKNTARRMVSKFVGKDINGTIVKVRLGGMDIYIRDPPERKVVLFPRLKGDLTPRLNEESVDPLPRIRKLIEGVVFDCDLTL